MNMNRVSGRFVIFLSLLMLALLTFSGCSGENDPSLITSYTALMQAVNEAADGDVILVGDIDFLPTSPDVVHSYMCIEIDRSITLKNGKRDGRAVFRNGSFKLVGSKITGEKTVCCFEGILFDGCADYTNLAASDFDYPWSEAEQAYTMYVPHDAQQALSFSGNVDADFANCTFRNYMHEYGPVIDIRYGDYTDNAYLLDLFGDYSGCRISLTFDDCRIEDNSAFYDGGAIYIEANKNVTLTARNCVISGNRSGRGQYRRGGGAIYASGALLDLRHCALEDNNGGYLYPGSDLYETDTNRGGALHIESGELRMVDTVVSGNRASMGGGISLTNSKAEIDGCTLRGNRAEEESLNPYGTVGPWSNMAQGGALYLEGINGSTTTLINCTIAENSAETAYGGIYGYYGGFEVPDDPAYLLKMSLCTYENNTVDAVYNYADEEMIPWCTHPGDWIENPYFSMFGCVVVDELFANTFPRNESPCAENAYNFISSSTDNTTRKVRIPAEAATAVLGSRYGDKLERVYVGSNYDDSLYQTERASHILWWLFGGGTLLILFGIVGCRILRKRRRVDAQTLGAESAPEQPIKQIVMTRYDDADIDRFFSLVQETQRLTGRELEVLREMLRGRKQGEVAYYLGIEVSTVKDYYRKIYDKLDVPNKEGLFRLASDVLSSK